ncbi:hypothetical protein TBLA_0A03760 [Henningerozyma blattae CBS 6284]|uniref:Serine/threonine-protein kinase RIO1 n=1 Tax=Henningerozyma blattae (strain ATCC 34711 / CBS 6284 / DSM 70876 / NBRC 10599 / NRRL Y-10934 / UCD 77-7) TaxID=1071380 RepID=I2GVM2_HENB6|nr:hypothetical protein TBLA_0A03760 [Tetrapisispora blattae CBS 6284]CCH58174.1 hypothetical protein TBLA_0A03760 [Tetrapisispora blattae CBS 6284]
MVLDDDFQKLDLSNNHDNNRILDKHGHKIKTDEFSISRGKTNKDKANRATVENVLDPRTMRFLKALTSRGIISDFNGCISTGKEANVYHAFAGDTISPFEPKTHDSFENLVNTYDPYSNPNNNDTILEPRKEYAIKIYKTSILVFKDRERYVDGEYRFRNSRSQHNPRKMIKIWAEKEFRNLKRIYQSKVIPVPKPIEVKNNVLVMEFLNRGDGFASPRLKDYPYKDHNDIVHYYHTMIVYIRLLYQVCRLVHADLSEYNTLVHKNKLYVIDVSQSVEPEHPMSLDFLRMDIKNINNYFERMGVAIFAERIIFQFTISETLDNFNGNYSNEDDLRMYVKNNLPLKVPGKDDAEDEIFRSLHLVRNLGGLEERDFDRYTDGKFDLLKSLIAHDNEKNFSASEQYNFEDNTLSNDDDDNEDDISNSDPDNSDSDDSDSDSDDNDDDDKVDVFEDKKDKVLKGKKYEDKEEKKQRKQEAKESKREKRKTKVKKHIKKKLVNKTKSKK